MFESIIQNGTLNATGFFVIIGVSLLFGCFFSFLVCSGTRSSASFGAAAALLPMAVAVVIALVNGNLGVGVAIAGAFGLVRFRSAPGTAREIAVIFIGMASGLAFGMGYLAYGALFLLISGILLFFFHAVTKNGTRASRAEKILRVTIPESLDYTNVFDDIFAEYTKEAELEKVKSVNMGSMFRLTYRIVLTDAGKEKELIDAVRTRNGNLEIQCSKADCAEADL